MKRVRIVGYDNILVDVEDDQAKALQEHINRQGFTGALILSAAEPFDDGENRWINLSTTFSVDIRDRHPDGEMVPALRIMSLRVQGQSVIDLKPKAGPSERKGRGEK